jgi:hypothetical protein
MRKVLLLLVLSLAAPLVRAAAPTETIVSIARPKAGKESELLAAVRETRAVYERLQAVTGPYTLYRGSDEAGGAYFIEIFTWRSGDIPDNAPPEIRAMWAKLQSLVEKRNGRPGIEFYAVEPVSEGLSLPAAGPSR